MKNIYKICIALIMLSFAAADLLHAQQEIMVRELHEYGFELESQADLPGHPMVGEEVTFDAVIVSYPKNSGLASLVEPGPDDNRTYGIPGRIHVFVTDVNAVTEGEEGMSIQIVVEGSQRETLEGLFRGDVIRVIGELTFFTNVSQFNATDVELLGSINEAEYEDLAPLLEPTVINLTDINQQSEEEGLHRWRADNYTTYINRYVKIEGLEVIDRLIADGGRPWFILSDGNTILTSNDTSLRFRNDRTNYAYDPGEDEGLGYNYRRLDEGLDGPFVPPAPGSVVDFSGFVVVNTFNPGGFDESTAQSTLKIAPWDDGVVWQNDGDDPSDRLTPEDWPNDFQILGFAPILQNLEVTPEDQVLSSDEATVSIDVLLPEDDYTLNSVEIQYTAYSYTEDEGTLVTEEMTSAGGDTYSFTFDEQDEFSTVDFEIIAIATTPEGVETNARESGSFFVESATQTSPVVLTPAAGTYINQVSVSMSSATDGATIYYTIDGEDPDENSEEYTTPLQIEETTTVRAIAIADGLDNSPVNSRTYEIEVQIVEVSTLAELRAGAQDGTTYEYTGEAVVTYARSARNQKYLMDDTGGILIDDANGIITSDYAIGDVMTNIIGTLSEFQTVVQFVPSGNPGDPQSTADVEPVSVTLNDLNSADHQSMLVRIEDASFVESGDFEASANYGVHDATIDAGSPVTFRTNFAEANYIDQPIPEGELNLVALVGGFGGNPQLTSRSDADFETPTSNEPGVNPYEFALDQNYPNPFNPATRINYSLAETAEVQLVVYDILGRRVASLANGIQTAGTYTINFDMSRFASGTYIYRLEAGDFVSVRKMMLIK